MQIPKLFILLCALGCQDLVAQTPNLLSDAPASLDASQLLRVDQAFRPVASVEGDRLEIDWQITPGYYLYRKQFQVVAAGEVLNGVQYEAGQMTYDPFFDQELEIYRDQTSLSLDAPQTPTFYLRFQGCADAGYCYPPSWLALELQGDSGQVGVLGLVGGPDQGAAPALPAPAARPGTLLLMAVGLLGLIIALCWALVGRRK